ncbi:C13 family peptidase [Oscillatoria salina]|uniref:C13 family peptidase n=1 Tax=Oscillatoria salina TaxID=331517 RepID=UPI0013B79E2C|nr:C13 family peptidase [Oscillatoria salina]MBZ8182632.1 Caspase domain-containing protein [Oscillatoria salina IIICB1]NET88348.1 Caspase domain-containing protein [Kamptonema sp. SIO1D9]
MWYSSLLRLLIVTFVSTLLYGSQIEELVAGEVKYSQDLETTTCQNNYPLTDFLVVAGGGYPGNNEIALEKNVLYFQRTLANLGYNPEAANIFFANGNDGQATIRYINEQREQQFKVPEIPNLQGAATKDNLANWLEETAEESSDNPLFFYFTGHGFPGSLLMWERQQLTVTELSRQLDKLPQNTPVVTMMAQCFSGSFADFIYQEGDPTQPIALQTRCGFFATVKTRPSVGCTPEVNEADYRDYSSSFFAGLSGVDRTGAKVASADYNRDGRISYTEAHAFAKVDEKTMDLPISTSESWLQDRVVEAEMERILSSAIASILPSARPEQKYVVNSIVQMFDLDLQNSYLANIATLSPEETNSEVQQAYLVRLAMELVNIASEKQIRETGDPQTIAILDRLIKCEATSPQ